MWGKFTGDGSGRLVRMARSLGVGLLAAALIGASAFAEDDDEDEAKPAGPDMSARSERFSNEKKSRLSGRDFTSPKLPEKYGERMEFKNYNSTFTSLGSQRAPIENSAREWGPTRERTIYPTKNVDRKDNAATGKMSSMEKLDYRKPTTRVAKYHNAYSSLFDVESVQSRDVSDDLSLQDVNRYQFRGSHSSEPGLPVQAAGKESETRRLMNPETDREGSPSGSRRLNLPERTLRKRETAGEDVPVAGGRSADPAPALAPGSSGTVVESTPVQERTTPIMRGANVRKDIMPTLGRPTISVSSEYGTTPRASVPAQSERSSGQGNGNRSGE